MVNYKEKSLLQNIRLAGAVFRPDEMEENMENENYPEIENGTGYHDHTGTAEDGRQDTMDSGHYTGNDGNTSDSGSIPFGNDYNGSTSQQRGQYSYTNQEQDDGCNIRNQGQGYHPENGGATYQAPDYGYHPDMSYRNGENYQNGGFYHEYQENRNDGFHNEYQESQGDGFQNGYQGNGNYYGKPENGGKKPKKPGSTAKIVAMVTGCVIVVGILAAVGFKGIDMLVSREPDRAALLEEEQQESGQVQENGKTEDGNKEDTSVEFGSTDVANNYSGAGNVSGDFSIVSDIVENAMPSMVSIDCTITETYNYFGQDYSQDATGSGSGFMVGENDNELFIATNNHVVEGANSIEITFIDGKKAQATTKGTDSTADLAVVSVKKSDLKKDTMDQIKIAKLGESNDIRLGQMVVAIGNALGYGQSVTVGYVSAKDREVEVAKGEKMVLLQTDAAINPGNSGGALINLNGEVIGIPTIKYADSQVEGMGFAIPITRATPILDELMKREVLTEGEQGYLGVSCLDVTSDANSMYNIPVGVYVSEVSDDGAAKEAGIQVGDIITAINGVETSSKEALVEKVHSYRIGTKITLTIQRSSNGKYKEMEVTAKLKGKSTIDGLSGSDESSQPDSGSNGSDGDSGNGNPDNGSNDYYNNGQDFYDFFNEFFN